jgi:hypothetical protein
MTKTFGALAVIGFVALASPANAGGRYVNRRGVPKPIGTLSY